MDPNQEPKGDVNTNEPIQRGTTVPSRLSVQPDNPVVSSTEPESNADKSDATQTVFTPEASTEAPKVVESVESDSTVDTPTIVAPTAAAASATTNSFQPSPRPVQASPSGAFSDVSPYIKLSPSPAPISAPVGPSVATTGAGSGLGTTGVVNGAGLGGDAPVKKSKNPFKRYPKKFTIPALIALLLVIGGVGFYFGYYTNSTLLYKESLSNSNKAYDMLVDYAREQSAVEASTMAVKGEFSVDDGEAFEAKGTVNFQGDTEKAGGTLDLSIGVLSIDAEARIFQNADSDTPDIFFKADGIGSLGSFVSESPEIQAQIRELDDKWVIADSAFIASATGAMEMGSESPSAPSSEQIFDAATKIGEVNRDYLFTTDEERAVTTVVEDLGTESIDGHKVQHYKIRLNKEQVKDYIAAQKKAIESSKLNEWITANDYKGGLDTAFTALSAQADDIKAEDTLDLWSDLNSRTVYKVRVSEKGNEAASYVEAGLNFKRGDDAFKYFVNFKSDGTDIRLDLTLDSAANNATIAVNGTFNEAKFTSKFTTSASTEKFELMRPTADLTIQELQAFFAVLQEQQAAASQQQGGELDAAFQAACEEDLAAGGDCDFSEDFTAPESALTL